jgi:hypothetical protein
MTSADDKKKDRSSSQYASTAVQKALERLETAAAGGAAAHGGLDGGIPPESVVRAILGKPPHQESNPLEREKKPSGPHDWPLTVRGG